MLRDIESSFRLEGARCTIRNCPTSGYNPCTHCLVSRARVFALRQLQSLYNNIGGYNYHFSLLSTTRKTACVSAKGTIGLNIPKATLPTPINIYAELVELNTSAEDTQTIARLLDR
jgi:hypothetical protein